VALALKHGYPIVREHGLDDLGALLRPLGALAAKQKQRRDDERREGGRVGSVALLGPQLTRDRCARRSRAAPQSGEARSCSSASGSRPTSVRKTLRSCSRSPSARRASSRTRSSGSTCGTPGAGSYRMSRRTFRASRAAPSATRAVGMAEEVGGLRERVQPRRRCPRTPARSHSRSSRRPSPRGHGDRPRTA
jgi:hypothetical protein